MSVFRVEKTKDYTVMSNYHLKDKSLSLKGKGLLSLMLSLPPEWDYSLAGLAYICKDGIDSVRSAVSELEKLGYLTKIRIRNEKGQLTETEYTIYEAPASVQPKLENPMLDKPRRGKPVLENPTQYNNHKSTIQKSNTDFVNHSINPADLIDTIDAYRKIIHNNISYDIIRHEYEAEKLNEIVEIMLECIVSPKDVIRIAKQEIAQEAVKSRFLKIDSSHIEYVFLCLSKNTTKIRNIKEYLKTVLYNSVVTISNFYSAEVNHDLYGDK
ncbi:MAG: DUF6017 domain-containing protein [Oscillospiraceae bacterium]|nr:DUF6017 domain-containing protein [Oscillospiraceae bacterium]